MDLSPAGAALVRPRTPSVVSGATLLDVAAAAGHRAPQAAWAAAAGASCLTDASGVLHDAACGRTARGAAASVRQPATVPASADGAVLHLVCLARHHRLDGLARAATVGCLVRDLRTSVTTPSAAMFAALDLGRRFLAVEGPESPFLPPVSAAVSALEEASAAWVPLTLLAELAEAGPTSRSWSRETVMLASVGFDVATLRSSDPYTTSSLLEAAVGAAAGPKRVALFGRANSGSPDIVAGAWPHARQGELVLALVPDVLAACGEPSELCADVLPPGAATALALLAQAGPGDAYADVTVALTAAAALH